MIHSIRKSNFGYKLPGKCTNLSPFLPHTASREEEPRATPANTTTSGEVGEASRVCPPPGPHSRACTRPEDSGAAVLGFLVAPLQTPLSLMHLGKGRRMAHVLETLHLWGRPAEASGSGLQPGPALVSVSVRGMSSCMGDLSPLPQLCLSNE